MPIAVFGALQYDETIRKSEKHTAGPFQVVEFDEN